MTKPEFVLSNSNLNATMESGSTVVNCAQGRK